MKLKDLKFVSKNGTQIAYQFNMKQIKILAVVITLLLLTPLAGQAQNATNTLTITEKSGANQSGRVISFGRPFAQGEIAQFPQALVNGTPVLTQADVKNRWNDGSVKFSIISFVAPTLTPNQTINISFQNAATGNNTGGLDAAGMLAAPFDFDAQIKIGQGGNFQTASARTMLQNNQFTYWLQGPIVTAIILADHSSARTYDMGFDTFRSFRPIFHAYFFPSNHEVKLSFIGEASNTEAAQDLTYDLELTRGQGHSSVYSKPGVHHIAFSRWIKRFSINPSAGDIQINMNTAYLVETKFLANYDLNLSIPQNIVSQVAGNWVGAHKDLYQAGFWEKHMPNSGGRGDIGPHTDWAMQYLFTWDNGLRDAVLGNADLAAAWPGHFREGRVGKKFDRGNSIDALGLPISLNARRTLLLFDENGYMNYSYTQAQDQITVVGTISNDGWHYDCAHQPEVWFVPYITTGEYWYLEQLQLWAARNAFHAGPLARNGGVYGTISDQTRGQAWSLRTRTLAAFISPDATPQKDYFNRLMIDAIAVWEGGRGIVNTPLASTEEYQWAHNNVGTLPTLHFWGPENGVSGASTMINTNVTGAIFAPWEYSFLLTSLGRARELGFPTDRLITYVGEFFIGAITDPGFSPYFIGDYQIPYRKLDTSFFTSWAETRTGYWPGYDPMPGYISGFGDVTHGYPHINRAAMSFIAQESGGALAWAFVQPQTQVAALNNQPKWAINPRNAPANTLFLSSLQPSAIQYDQPNQVVISGINIDSNFTGLEIDGNVVNRASLNLTFVSSTQVNWSIPANHFQPASYSIKIINPNNVRSNALTLVVQLQAPAPGPILTGLNPNSISNTAASVVTLSGTHFDTQGGKVRINNVDVPASRVTFVSATSITLAMPQGTAPATYFVTVINGDQQMSNALPLVVTDPNGGSTGSGGSGNTGGSNPGTGGANGGGGGGFSSGSNVNLLPSSADPSTESGDIAGFGCSQGRGNQAQGDLALLAILGLGLLWSKRFSRSSCPVAVEVKQGTDRA